MPKTITREELSSKLEEPGQLSVVEALPQEYYRSGHLPGAIPLPPSSADETVLAALVDRSRTVVTYCTGPTCMNSRQLAERLETLGFQDVRIYVGGKTDWKEAGLSLEEGK